MIWGFHTLSQRWQLWADISCGQWYYQVKHKKLFVGAIIIIIITGREQQKSAASTVQLCQELTQSQLEGDYATAWLFSIGLDIRWWRWWWSLSIWSPPWAACAASSMCNIVHIIFSSITRITSDEQYQGEGGGHCLLQGRGAVAWYGGRGGSSSVFVSSSQLDFLLFYFFVFLLTSCITFQGAECRAWVADAHMAREVTRWWGVTNIMTISKTTGFYISSLTE